MPRFYVDLPLSVGQSLDLPEAVARHVQVLRMQPMESLHLFNGQGGEFAGEITAMGKKTVSVLVHEFHAVDRESPLNLTLVQAITAADRMDYTVQKAAELGVTVLQPVISQYCQQRYSGERAEKRLGACQLVCQRHTLGAFGAHREVRTVLPVCSSRTPLAET